jgi:hypothetical protein
MSTYFNRYKKLNNDEVTISPPFVKLDEKGTDSMVIYDARKSRLDKISQEFYGVPYYGFLILLANPEFGGLEWNIKDGQAIRIPLPLDVTLREYDRKIMQRLEYYGN